MSFKFSGGIFAVNGDVIEFYCLAQGYGKDLELGFKIDLNDAQCLDSAKSDGYQSELQYGYVKCSKYKYHENIICNVLLNRSHLQALRHLYNVKATKKDFINYLICSGFLWFDHNYIKNLTMSPPLEFKKIEWNSLVIDIPDFGYKKDKLHYNTNNMHICYEYKGNHRVYILTKTQFMQHKPLEYTTQNQFESFDIGSKYIRNITVEPNL